MFINGEKTGEGKVDATAAMIFSSDDTCDVGKEDGAHGADDYPTPNNFTGQANWLQIDVSDASEDPEHYLSPDELLRIAVARQQVLTKPSRDVEVIYSTRDVVAKLHRLAGRPISTKKRTQIV